MKVRKVHRVEAADDALVEQLVREGRIAELLEELRCAGCEARLELLKDGRTIRCTGCYQGRVELTSG